MNPIILLHGALGASSQLEPLQQALQAKGRLVHTLNFSGHSGEPFRTGFGIETFADDLAALIANQSISKADIFGYSMGGYVALWYAHHHPQHVGTVVTLGTKFDWSVESAAHEVKKMNADKIQEKVPAFARILEKRHAPNDWKELLKKTADMMMTLGNSPLLTPAILKTITTPVTVCLGDQDDMADRRWSEQVAELLPHGNFRLFENTPHPIEKVDLNNLLPLLA